MPQHWRHFTNCCRYSSTEQVLFTETDGLSQSQVVQPTCDVNIYKVTSFNPELSVFWLSSDFKRNVISNETLASVTADTGAKVCLQPTTSKKVKSVNQNENKVH